MAFEAFLKLEGVPGESLDAKHKDEIEILSFAWGVDQTGTVFAPGGAEVAEFNLQALYSKASPRLFELAVTGGHSPEALLTLRKGGETPLEFLKYKFTDVLISGYQTSGSSDDDRPLDSFSLNFARVDIEYTEQKEDGSAGTVTRASYDLAKKKA